MKLFVQIPCLNEAATLPSVLQSIPKDVPGFQSVEILVIDDGSTDGTAQVAQEHGVSHILRHRKTMGLATSFKDGVDYCLAHGADVVVNTDGDNQYPQERIPDLVLPLVDGSADMVIADRQTAKIDHFSPFKKSMQRIGSSVVSRASATNLPDAASGFRAYTRAALLRINIMTQFSYAMESTIQAGNKGLRIESVPVTTNAKTRESRLFTSQWQHMGQSASAIVRSYLMFKPHTALGVLAAVMILGALVPIVRFLAYALSGDSSGHIQSLVLGAALLVGGLVTVALLVIADLQRANRILLEDLLERVKTQQYGPAADQAQVTRPAAGHGPPPERGATGPSASLSR